MASTTGSIQSPSVQGRAPDQFTKSLQQACAKSSQTDLFSTVHYRFLAEFLKPTSRHTPPAAGLGRRASATAAGRQREDRFTYAVVHTISNGKIKRHDFDHKLGLDEFWKFPDAEPKTDQIVFLRGSLSPAWLELLGSKYKVDPEFFRRHLQYMSRSDYSDLPPLPSSTNTLTLSVTSSYTRSLGLNQDLLKKRRIEDSDVARSNQQAICQKAACGESVIRKISTLSSRFLSIEHDISIYIRERSNGRRLAIVLLDNGLNLNRDDGPPCFNRTDSQVTHRNANDISLNPIIIPRPDTVHTGVVHPQVPNHDQAHAKSNSFCHVVSLLPFHFGMSLSPENFSTAPRTEMPVLLKEVFMLVASAECQFLNRVHGVTREQQKYLDNEKQMELALNTLLYIKALLDDHKQRLQQTIAFLKAHETQVSESLPSGQIPRAAAASQTVPRGELRSILADFEELLNRSKDLGDFCIESMDLIMNTAMLRESQKAVGRADDQKRLTILAYLFLPLSLVASFFGMNVKELGTGSQHIWLPVIILGPVTLFAWALSHPNYFEPWVVKLTKSRRSEIPTYQTQGAT